MLHVIYAYTDTLFRILVELRLIDFASSGRLHRVLWSPQRPPVWGYFLPYDINLY